MPLIQNQLKKQIEKHKQNQLVNTNQGKVFTRNLDEIKITQDVLLSSVKSAVDKGQYTYDVHENRPIFKTPHPACPATSNVIPHNP